MAHERAAVLRHQRVERVDRLCVDVVHPGREHAVATQLAAIFVRHDVVGVVGTGAEEADAAHRLALERLARHHPERSVGFAIDAGQEHVEIAALHRALPPALRREGRGVADQQVLGTDVGDVILGHVIAERPHQLGHRDLGAGGHAAVAARIELQKPLAARRVGHGEPGRHAVALRRDDRPGAGGRTVGRVRPLRDVLRGQGARTGAIGVPARIRHLVDGVQVAGAAARRAGALDHVVGEVHEQVHLVGLQAGGVLRVQFLPHRIIVEELRRGRRAGGRERARGEEGGQHRHQPAGRRGGRHERHPLNSNASVRNGG